MKTKQIAQIELQDWPEKDLHSLIDRALHSTEFFSIVTPNPEFLLLVRSNTRLRSVLNSASLHGIDGIGLQFASHFLFGESFACRATGGDIMAYILRKNRHRDVVFIVGDEIESINAEGVRAFNPGPVNDEEFIHRTAENVRDGEIVMLGIPMQYQLLVIEALKESSKSVVVIGVGGAVLTYFGYIARAPVCVRKVGLEWLWRLMKDPSVKRLKRIFSATVVFPLWILSVKLRGDYGKKS